MVVRIVWAGTHARGVYRNRQWARLLEESGVEFREVRENLWGTDGDFWRLTNRRLSVIVRMPLFYLRLIARLLAKPAPDIYLVTYPGWFDVPMVWLVARLRNKPVLFDPFISLWDTVVVDRELTATKSLTSKLLYFVDRIALRLADRVVADTGAHLELYAEIAGRGIQGFVLPVGSDEQVFRPAEHQRIDERLVAFYGTYVPLQGVATIIRAAQRLPAINFRIVGGGQERPAVERLIAELELSNVELLDAVSYAELPSLLAPAAVCLGIFGSSDKAGNVVPHKVYDYLAMGKPVISRGSRALDQMGLADAVITVPPSDPVALAGAISVLVRSETERNAIGQRGRRLFESQYSSAVLARGLREVLETVVAGD